MGKNTAGVFVDLERAAIGRRVTGLGVSFFPGYLRTMPRLRGGAHVHPSPGASYEERGVARQAARAEARRGGQNAVWKSVDAELVDFGVASPTRVTAAADGVYEREPGRQAAVEELGARGAVPGLMAQGRRGWPAPWSSGPRIRAAPLVGAGAGLSARAAHRPRPALGCVLRKPGRVCKGGVQETLGLELDVERHLVGGKGVGRAVTLDGGVVHASVLRE